MPTENKPDLEKDKRETTLNNPEKAINKPAEVQESNDEKIDQDFPGYPHYPAKDDILNPDNHMERLDVDVEKLTRSQQVSKEYLNHVGNTPEVITDVTQEDDEETDIQQQPANDADVTPEDIALLGDRDEDLNMDEDEELKAKGWKPKSSKDLDVPDVEDEVNEPLGVEDEENSYYSLGGDEKNGLEENEDRQ